MEFETLFPLRLEGSSLDGGLRALHALYAQADAATALFRDKAAGFLAAQGSPGFGCPDGCGSCCERFVPDLLPLESDYIALYILRLKPELASVQARDLAPCPYYDAQNADAHCRIYEARPLVCRLFGFASVGSKNGARAYSLCWRMDSPAADGSRAWEGKALGQVFGFEPPYMAEFGLRLQSLSAEGPRPRSLIVEAVRASHDRLSYLLSLIVEGG